MASGFISKGKASFPMMGDESLVLIISVSTPLYRRDRPLVIIKFKKERRKEAVPGLKFVVGLC